MGIKAPSSETLRRPNRSGGNMYRSNSCEEDFSKDMQDPIARREYFLALVHDEDEAMLVEEALRFTIRRMGTVEFAVLVGEKNKT